MKRLISSLAVIAVMVLATNGWATDAGGQPADMSKSVKVFILLGQSNMVGGGRVGPETKDGTLEHAVKVEKKYPYLVDKLGNWVTWKDVRYVQFIPSGTRLVSAPHNEWMTAARCSTIGPEFGIAECLRQATDAPIMVLKSCCGNRGLNWDLLPPGSKRYLVGDQVYAGYKDRPPHWTVDPAKGVATDPPPWLGKNGKPIGWYAGIQYEGDLHFAKQALADLNKYYPGAKGYTIAGFFFWQGDRDRYDAVSASHYEKNLVDYIKSVRKDFNAPKAPFVLATLGQTVKGETKNANEAKILAAQLAVSDPAKYPEFKGNVATVYTHPLSLGGGSNSHYNGNAETYMNVGEAMGKAMVKLLKNK